MRKRHRRWIIAWLLVLSGLGIWRSSADPIVAVQAQAQLRAQTGRFYYLLKLEAAHGSVMLYLSSPTGEQFAELFGPDHPAAAGLHEFVALYRDRPAVVEFSLRQPAASENPADVSSYLDPHLRDFTTPISSTGALH